MGFLLRISNTRLIIFIICAYIIFFIILFSFHCSILNTSDGEHLVSRHPDKIATRRDTRSAQEDIVLEAKKLIVRRNLTLPKAEAGNRVVYLTDAAADILRGQKKLN